MSMESPTDHLIRLIEDMADDVRVDPQSGLIIYCVPDVEIDRYVTITRSAERNDQT